jgi:hypothetical protein
VVVVLASTPLIIATPCIAAVRALLAATLTPASLLRLLREQQQPSAVRSHLAAAAVLLRHAQPADELLHDIVFKSTNISMEHAI